MVYTRTHTYISTHIPTYILNHSYMHTRIYVHLYMSSDPVLIVVFIMVCIFSSVDGDDRNVREVVSIAGSVPTTSTSILGAGRF